MERGEGAKREHWRGGEAEVGALLGKGETFGLPSQAAAGLGPTLVTTLLLSSSLSLSLGREGHTIIRWRMRIALSGSFPASVQSSEGHIAGVLKHRATIYYTNIFINIIIVIIASLMVTFISDTTCGHHQRQHKKNIHCRDTEGLKFTSGAF